MFGSHFYHERIRKAVATFGSLFNNLWVVRKDASGKTLNQQKVPLSYSPSDKYLQRIRENASLVNDMKVAIKLPRMSFEMISLAYDPTRMLPKTGNISVAGTDNTKRKKIFNTVPYNIAFQLNIYARSQDDCLQIVEQILPYFSPQYTVTIKPLEDYPSVTEDVPIVLNGVSFVDEYEGALEERRTIIYTLDFEMKCNFHSDITESSIVRKAINNIYQTAGGIQGEDLQSSRVTLLPDPNDVSRDSDFGFTQIVQKYEDLFAATYALTMSAEPAEGLATLSSTYGVASITLADSGSGFSFEPEVIISSPPDAITATAVAILDSATRRITRIDLIDSGTNYLTTPVIAIASPSIATTATATATLDGSRIGSITVTGAGTNYDGQDSAPTVTISAPDVGDSAAVAIAVVNDSGVISAIRLTDSGNGYSLAPTVTIQAPPAAVTAQAVAVVSDQQISYINLTDSGTNYYSAPSVSVAAPPGATQATATATINIVGQLTGITITDPGSNYRTTPTVSITNPVPFENEQYTDSEQVTLTFSDGVIVTAFVKSWNDSDNILTIDNLSASDNGSRSLVTGLNVVGQTSNSSLIISSIIEGDKGF